MARPSIFAGKFTNELAAHLSNMPPTSMSIDSLSRLSPDRLSKTALPNIGSIELVASEDFMPVYNDLYVSMFPKRTERESSQLIVERLAAQAAGLRAAGVAPYRIVGIRDHSGEAIGAAQFSVLSLPAAADDDDNNGAGFAVPYLQYIYVRTENRRQDMSEVLHTMVLAVSAADVANEGRTVPFTLFETEPPGHGDDAESRAYALQRAKIHTSAGGVALVLRREADGKLLSAHVQPGLEENDQPLTLTWVIRTSPNPGRDYDIRSIGGQLVAAYYQSLRDEGFPPNNIHLAESIVQQRCRGSTFETMALVDVVDHVD